MVPNTYLNTTIHLCLHTSDYNSAFSLVCYGQRVLVASQPFMVGYIITLASSHHHHFDNRAGSRDHAPNIRTWDHFDVLFFPSLQYFRSSFHMTLT